MVSYVLFGKQGDISVCLRTWVRFAWCEERPKTSSHIFCLLQEVQLGTKQHVVTPVSWLLGKIANALFSWQVGWKMKESDNLVYGIQSWRERCLSLPYVGNRAVMSAAFVFILRVCVG